MLTDTALEAPKSPSFHKSHLPSSHVLPVIRSGRFTYRISARHLHLALLLIATTLVLTLRLTDAGLFIISHLASHKHFWKLYSIDPAFLDNTRAREHRTVLKPSVAYELALLQTTGVLADWYGDPKNVGPSPFDYTIPPEWQARLAERDSWSFVAQPSVSCDNDELEEICDMITEIKTSRHRRARLIDPYSSEPVHANVLVTSQRLTPLSISGKSTSEMASIRQPYHIHILDECSGRNCTAGVNYKSGQITLARHAFELVDFFEFYKLAHYYGTFSMQIFAHLPYAASPFQYYPLERGQSKSKRFLDVDGILREHEEDILPLPSAHDFRHAHLCLFTSTKKKRMSREWVKAMLSDCVIVSDMPTESEEIFEDCIISYDSNASREEIWEVITDALEDETELKRKALRAFIHARQHFTPARQVGYILELTELYRSGERGYEFPLPFSVTCREYPDGSTPGWCQTEQRLEDGKDEVEA